LVIYCFSQHFISR